MRHFQFLFLLLPLPILADIPPELPNLDRRVQVNSSNIMMPSRVFLRWKMTDGRWWCVYDTKENVRAAMIQRIDDMLSPYGSGASSWRDVNLIFSFGTGTMGTFEKTWCFSWLPK